MTHVCHVTPHLGGGVGRVLLGMCGAPQTRFSHEILCLEYCNEAAAARAAQLGVPVVGETPREVLLERMARADLVLVHWWNHPLLMQLLINWELPACRLLLWSHVGGHTAPQVFTKALIALPDLFVVASPHSLQAPALRGSEEHVRLVFTSAGIAHVADVQPVPHEGFVVGYIGTVDYCKMHPEFLRLSEAAQIPDVRFVVCGGDKDKEIGASAGQKFDFLGHVPDIRPHLASFDVFGYPLNREHYGTGEQALIEALAAGVVPVVLAGGAESYVVEDGVTGLVVSAQDYPHALERLQRDPVLRARLSANARQQARERFTLGNTLEAWHKVYDEALGYDKRRRRWSEQVAATGADLFLASVAANSDQFQADISSAPYAFKTPTRGTPFHYRTFFPEDTRLAQWCGLLRRGA